MFEGGRGAGKGEFDSPTGIAVDATETFLVADTTTGASRSFRRRAVFLALSAPKDLAMDS